MQKNAAFNLAIAGTLCLCHAVFGSGLKLVPVSPLFSFQLPIAAAAPDGEFGVLYVAEERQARVSRLDLQTGEKSVVLHLPYTFTGVETGLNGIAFHNDKLYVNISGISTDPEGTIKILEYSRSQVDPSVFDFATERKILSIPNPALSHNGGWIEFGPHDGLLYIGTGDGGHYPPVEPNGLMAQNPDHLWGKILRINVDGDDFPEDLERNYSIPQANPYALGGGAPEVLAIGLRHPFRAGFDRLTGDLYIADVGSNYFEEINFLPANTGGQNYGWRPLEGFEDNPFYSDPHPPNAIDPIHAYPHGSGAAVIGGYVYRGQEIPWLQGTYFFSDYIQKAMYSFRYDGDILEFVDRTAEFLKPLGSAYGLMPSYALDANGELYVLDLGRGQVLKIVARTPRESGDYNNDGVVNAADYTVWRNLAGQTAAGLAADGNGDGKVDQADYLLWKENYGWEIPYSTPQDTVPSPATSGLAAVAAIFCGAVRRRRRL